MENHDTAAKKHSFTQKVWIVGGIFALITTLLLLFEATFNVLVLILAGGLVAVYFRGLGELIQKKTNWNSTLTLTISIVGTILLIAGVVWLIGAKTQDQISQLTESLPASIENAKDYLKQSMVGRKVVAKIAEARSDGDITSIFTQFFKSSFGALADIYIVLLVGIFFTSAPHLYTKGVVTLVPTAGQEKAKKILSHLGNSMKKWLAGKIFAMFVVFVLTAIGLIAIGMPMWLALSIIAGFLNFIPNFGPLFALIPALLVALSIDPTTALLVAILYNLVQLLESSLITPKAQQRLVKIPPALIIISQVLVGTFTGIWGIILATPLLLIVIVLVQELYIKPRDEKSKT